MKQGVWLYAAAVDLVKASFLTDHYNLWENRKQEGIPLISLEFQFIPSSGGLHVHVEELTKVVDQLIDESRFHSAIAECDKLLAGPLANADRVTVLLRKARAHTALDGRWGGPGGTCLGEALTLTPPQSPERARVHAAFTAFYGTQGCAPQCKEHAMAFRVILSKTESPDLLKYEPLIEYNLALAYHERDILRPAEDGYSYARTLCLRFDDPEIRGRVPFIEHNLVDVLHELGEFEDARRMMDSCYDALPEARFGAQMRNQRAIHDLHVGDLAGATLWVESGLGHPACDVKTRTALTLTQAKVALAGGHIVAANDLGIEALRLAAIASSSRLSSRVTRFLNQELAKGV